MSDALRNSPGITFTLGENGNTTTGDSVFMRGFDTSSSIFVDGIRDLGTVTRDVFNTEQIEIVKGPSGSDNGRSTPTGYLNMASQGSHPRDQRHGKEHSHRRFAWGRGRVTFEPESLGLAVVIRVRPCASTPCTTRATRLAATSRCERLWRWGIAPSFAIGLAQQIRAPMCITSTSSRTTSPDGGISSVGMPGYSNPLLSTVAQPVEPSNFYGSMDDFDDVKANMLTVRIEHDLSDHTTLRNMSRYGRTEEQYVLTGINAIVVPNAANPATWLGTRSRQAKDQENQILTNQTSLVTSFKTGLGPA